MSRMPIAPLTRRSRPAPTSDDNSKRGGWLVPSTTKDHPSWTLRKAPLGGQKEPRNKRVTPMLYRWGCLVSGQLPRKRQRLLAMERVSGGGRCDAAALALALPHATGHSALRDFVPECPSDNPNQSVWQIGPRVRLAPQPRPKHHRQGDRLPTCKGLAKVDSVDLPPSAASRVSSESQIHAGPPIDPCHADPSTNERGDGGPCSTGTSVRSPRTGIRLLAHYRRRKASLSIDE